MFPPASKTNNSLSIHNEPDARSAPGHSIPVDNKADTLSRASDDSQEKYRCLLLYAIERGPHKARSYIPSVAGKAASDTEENLRDSLGDAGSTPFFPKTARPNQRYSTAFYAGLWSESETADRVWPNPYPDEDGA